MEDQVLTNEEFLALLEQIASETTTEYNLKYQSDKTIDEETILYLLAFGVVVLFGYNALKGRTDVRKDIKDRVLGSFPKDYKGIKETSKQELNDLIKKLGRQPTAKELEQFRKQRIEKIVDGAYYSTRNELERIYAEQDGLSIVGAITVGDNRVRDEHRDNDQRYWRAETYQPWTDYNCRCTYVYFGSPKEAREAGFRAL